MSERLSPEELIQLTEYTHNNVGEVLDTPAKIRHYLYVTILRPEVIRNLLPSLSNEIARNRLQRYIREEFTNILGPDGTLFNNNSTKELYDEYLTVLRTRIRRLQERKRREGKDSKASTSNRMEEARPVRQPRRARVTNRRVVPALPVAAPAAAQPQIGQRRRASSSPKSSSNEALPNEIDIINRMFGDFNLNVAPAPRRVRRAVRPRTAATQLTARQQAALQLAQQREQEEQAALVRRQETGRRRTERRIMNADTRRAAEGELANLVGQFRL